MVNQILSRSQYKIIHRFIGLTVIVMVLVGLTTPAMGTGCQCPCCDLVIHGQPQDTGHHQGKPLSESQASGCNHCSFDPIDPTEVAVTLPSLVAKHSETPVRLAMVAMTSLMDREDGIYANRTTNGADSLAGPIYLQTLSIRR